MKQTLFFLLLVNFTYSQNFTLFDRTFHNRTEDSKSNNKRVYEITDSIIKIKDYKKNILFRTGDFYGFTDVKNLDEFIWFNSNRQYNRSPNLITQNRKGFVKYLNKKGEVTTEQMFDEDKTKFTQIWAKNIPRLTNGNGNYVVNFAKKKEKFFRVFKDSVEVNSFIVREIKNDTIHLKVDTNAYPKKGLKNFYSKLASTINYPKFAKFLGVSKKITIEFTVDEKGKLTDFTPLHSKSFSFEKKAIKKLERMPKWIPATRNGKNVKTRFRIPLTFKN